MKIKCQFMEIGKPLYISGTNYGERLKPKHDKGTLEIYWDEEKRRAEVHSSKGYFTYITEPWVFSYEPEQDRKVPQVQQNQHPDHRILPINPQIGGPTDVFNAQVETPHSKVQKRGRPPKYQGESEQGE